MLHFVSEYDPSTTGFEAGFKIDLNNELIKHPNSTYLVQMDSNELIGNHIIQGDILVVDRSPTPKNNDLILAYLNGEKLVRYYEKSKSTIRLYNATLEGSDSYTIASDDLFEIFGVVTNCIRTLKLNQ
jgi:DNA polymerase V